MIKKAVYQTYRTDKVPRILIANHHARTRSILRESETGTTLMSFPKPTKAESREHKLDWQGQSQSPFFFFASICPVQLHTCTHATQTDNKRAHHILISSGHEYSLLVSSSTTHTHSHHAFDPSRPHTPHTSHLTPH